MELEKNFRFNRLFDFYKELLTAKQREITAAYIAEDFSLSEIAVSFGITRQATSDLMKRTESLLEDYEKKLKLIEKFERRAAILEELMGQTVDELFLENLRKLEAVDDDNESIED